MNLSRIYRFLTGRAGVACNIAVSALINKVCGLQENCKDAKQIMVVQLFEIGDLILSSVFLQNLKKNFPKASITLVCGEWSKSFAPFMPMVDRILILNASTANSCSKRFRWGVWRHLRYAMSTTDSYDIVFELRGNLTIDLMVAMWLIRRSKLQFFSRAALTVAEVKANVKRNPNRAKIHEVDKQLLLLQTAGLEVYDRRNVLSVPLSTGSSPVEDFSLPSDYIVVHIGAGDRSKIWPAENVGKFVQLFRSTFPSIGVVFSGTGSDLELEPATRSLIMLAQQDRWIIDAVGKTNLIALAQVLQKGSLFISADTGILHLAVALVVPTIGLYGTTDPDQFGPYNGTAPSVIIRSGRKARTMLRRPSPFDKGDVLASIPAEHVMEKVSSLLEVSKHGR